MIREGHLNDMNRINGTRAGDKMIKIIVTVGLLALALFFGAYAAALEFRGIINLDQMVCAVFFGVLVFISGRRE